MLDTSRSLVEGASYYVTGSFYRPDMPAWELGAPRGGRSSAGHALSLSLRIKRTTTPTSESEEARSLRTSWRPRVLHKRRRRRSQRVLHFPDSSPLKSYDTWGQCESCIPPTQAAVRCTLMAKREWWSPDLSAYDNLKGSPPWCDLSPGRFPLGQTSYLFERVDDGCLQAPAL